MSMTCRITALALAACLSGAGRAEAAPAGTGRLPRTAVAWNASAAGGDSLDQRSFLTALRVTGLRPRQLGGAALAAYDLTHLSLLVVPNVTARSLPVAQTRRILRAVRQGLCIITDGESPLTRALGIRTGTGARVGHVLDHFAPGSGIRWADSPRVSLLASLPAGRSKAAYSSAAGPLAAVVRSGRGRCLVFAPLFDPLSGEGYARFPTLPELLVRELRVVPGAARNGIDVYFDPGYRYDKTPAELARLWKRRGIRAVHAAAWYLYAREPYPYGELVRAVHAQGMLCYAWLQWPYVGGGFWDSHPAWREKNGLLQDAHFFFLQLMDFQNPACRDTALADLGRLMREDWDGIDMAEFSITGGAAEALEGPARPAYFTGFSDVSRRHFASLAGFDPAALFDTLSPHFWKRDSAGLRAFYRYREQVNSSLLDHLMHSLDSLKQAEGPWWELMLTILDVTPYRDTGQLLATNLTEVLALAARHRFTLQVEDLASEWSGPPGRYERMGEKFRTMIRGAPLAIDINVVPAHPATQAGFPTDQAVGVELARQWEAASVNAPRVCFYAEQSVFPPDWEFLPFTFASGVELDARGDSLLVKAPVTARLIAGAGRHGWLLDGYPWGAGGAGGALLPVGNHVLRPVPHFPSTRRPELLDISDDLLGCVPIPGGLEIEYRSPARCALTLSKRPDRVKVDGADAPLSGLEGNGGFVLLAPPGHHHIQVFSGPPGRK